MCQCNTCDGHRSEQVPDQSPPYQSEDQQNQGSCLKLANTTWPYSPQVSMCAIISVTLHITLFVAAITYVATVIVTMMPLPCQCKQCFSSEIQLLAQVDYNKPCG